MERESFEDSQIAKILNKSYISIKVDREERPDVDSIYMRICQMMTGSGGWPLTVIMDADRRPFFAGTYFPKGSVGGRLGFEDILLQIKDVWDYDRDKIVHIQAEIFEAINEPSSSEGQLTLNVVSAAISALKNSFDPVYGGFGGAPKFPSPHKLMLLLRFWKERGDETAKEIALKTLNCMAVGGIYDHVGYGFSRYSTDRMWLVPHFEKMLYDNALLTLAYCEAFLVTGDEGYRKTVYETLAYVSRVMTDRGGGFFSAEDADSEGVEGKFYTWSMEEIENILGEADSERFCRLYGITEEGNFESLNIPNLIKSGLPETEVEFAKGCVERLYREREKRKRPHKDVKILTSWNGLMIAAFSYAGRVFGNSEYVKTAEKAVSFIFDKLFDGVALYTRYCNGEILRKSFSEDYANMIWGLIELYQATFEEKYLEMALDLNRILLNEFYDDNSSGVYLYPKRADNILIRPKEIYDGATPSANSVAAYNLTRLARLTGNFEYERIATKLLEHFAEEIKVHPEGYAFALISLLYMNSKSQEVVITAYYKASAEEALRYLSSRFLPFTTTVLLTDSSRLSKLIPHASDYSMPNKGWKAYVCRSSSCLAGVGSVEALKICLNS